MIDREDEAEMFKKVAGEVRASQKLHREASKCRGQAWERGICQGVDLWVFWRTAMPGVPCSLTLAPR